MEQVTIGTFGAPPEAVEMKEIDEDASDVVREHFKDLGYEVTRVYKSSKIVCRYEQRVSEGFGLLACLCLHLKGFHGSLLALLDGHHPKEAQKSI